MKILLSFGKIRSLLVACAVMSLVACSSIPETKLHEEREAKTEAARELMKSKPVVLDARPAFVAATEPIGPALTVEWRDFTTQTNSYPNTLVADLYFHARRLARMGITPDTPVIVLGRGAGGEGEEGRLAWTLKYMGVKDVRFMSADRFRFPRQEYPAPEPQAAPIWKPDLQQDLFVPYRDVRTELKAGAKLIRVTKEWEVLAPLSLERRQALFEKSYGPPPQNLIVLDNKGVRSAGLTLWLVEAGYRARCACEY